MGLSFKTIVTKLPKEKIIEQGLSGKLMPYRFTKGATAAIFGVAGGISVTKEISKRYNGMPMGEISKSENLDRLISIDGTGALNKINEVSGGDIGIEKDIIKHTFDKPNQAFTHNNLVFALHNRRDG